MSKPTEKCPVCQTPGHTEGGVTRHFVSHHEALISQARAEGKIEALREEAKEFREKGWLGPASGASNLADHYEAELRSKNENRS